jgi:choline dehydrogenase
MTRFPLQHLGACDMRDDPTPCERIVVYAGLLISFVASWAAIVWLAMMLAGCKQIDWPTIPWTNVVIRTTTTTTIPPAPTPTIPPTPKPAKDLRGNYDPLSCNPINLRHGQRVTTNDGYLEPARGRANLTIRGNALVDRVIFEGRRAVGVRVRFGAGTFEDISAREVVLCAGAIHSPCILMRSGIGPAAALQGLGIAVLHDAPAVGQHFMDHPILRASLALKPGFRAKGADARHNNCCLTYSSKLGGGGERDMIIIAYNHRGLAEGGVAPNGGIGVALYDALSRGEVRLTSADPDAQPVVEENMLDHPADRLRMRDGVRRLAKLCALSPVANIADAITFGETTLSMTEAAALADDALDQLMLDQAGDIQHAAGTCRMTAHEDPRGVVDPDLKLRGVEGVRVADASIMPYDCRANLHFTCVMIGEAAARRMRAAG